MINVADHDAHCRMTRGINKKYAVVGCTGGENVIIPVPSPRMMYELFSMVWVSFWRGLLRLNEVSFFL